MWEVGQDVLGAVAGRIRPGRFAETCAAFYALRADKFVDPGRSSITVSLTRDQPTFTFDDAAEEHVTRLIVSNRPTLCRAALALGLTLQLACGRQSGRNAVSDHGGDVGRSESASLVAHSRDSLGLLITQLTRMPGTFEDSGSRAWRLETAGPVFEAIATFGDSAVVRLVDCIRDTTRARTVARGRAVLAGAMCYEALIQMAYYEAYDQRPDSAGKYEPWEGDLTPTANAKELLRAQLAWQMVVRAKKYRLL